MSSLQTKFCISHISMEFCLRIKCRINCCLWKIRKSLAVLVNRAVLKHFYKEKCEKWARFVQVCMHGAHPKSIPVPVHGLFKTSAYNTVQYSSLKLVGGISQHTTSPGWLCSLGQHRMPHGVGGIAALAQEGAEKGTSTGMMPACTSSLFSYLPEKAV